MTPEIAEIIRRLRETKTERTYDSVGRAYDYPADLPILAADALQRLSERIEEAVKAERERCAKIAEPKGPRPCDCEYGACYCRNAGDAAAVASWDADMAVARAIRAPVSGSTEGGNV